MPPLAVILADPLLASSSESGSPEDSVLCFVADQLHRVRAIRRRLRVITLEVTTRCNLSCRHCYMESTRRRPEAELSFVELCGLALSIRREFGTRVPISITGGEPLARRDIFLLLAFMKLLGLGVTLSTNGTWLYPECVDRLVGRVAGISVSLDGFEESHDRLRGAGAYRAALSGLRRVVAAGLPGVVVKTAVHRGNLGELSELHDFVAGLGADEWHIFAVEPWGRASGMRGELLSDREYEALCDFFDSVKEASPWVCFEEQTSFERARSAREGRRYSRCSAGVSSLAILANGDVVPCVQVAGVRPEVQGNVRDTSLGEIWKRGFAANRARDRRCCGCHRYQ